MRKILWLGLSCAALAAACGDDDGNEDPCASVSFENSALAIDQKYHCTNCHDSALSSALERSSAPSDVNFDMEAGWLEHGHHAVEEMEEGKMPVGGPQVSAEEIARLEQWLSCEGAEDHEHEHEHE